MPVVDIRFKSRVEENTVIRVRDSLLKILQVILTVESVPASKVTLSDLVVYVTPRGKLDFGGNDIEILVLAFNHEGRLEKIKQNEGLIKNAIEGALPEGQAVIVGFEVFVGEAVFVESKRL